MADMNFEETMDPMRMNLELAFHDIEGLRGGLRDVRGNLEHHHDESLETLVKPVSELLQISRSHDRRIARLEKREQA